MSDPSRLQHDHPSALASGTRLGEFELRGLLGVGGFGIVYLAFDHALEREVAIKEYMPASLAGRTETLHVSIRSQSDAESFALGLKSFVNEAKLLARFDHPSLLKVLRFWEANGTAYMAMPVLRGRTLKQIRQEMGGPPDEASALTVQQLPGCSEAFLGAIDWMLSPRPTDRPQSVADLREVLAGRASAPPRRAVEQAPVHWERTRVLVPGGEGADFSAERAEAPTQRIDSTVRAAATSEHVWLEPDASVRATGPVAAASGRVPPPAGRPAWLLPLGLLAVACAVAAVVFWPSPASVPQAAATSPAPAAVAPAATEAIPAAAASAVTTGAAVAVDLPAPPVVGAPGSLPIKTSEAAPAVSAKPAAPRPVAARPPLEAAAPRPDTASPPADVGAAAGPPPACGASTGVRYHVCMERECGTAAFAAHPSCQRWKQDARRD